MLYYQLTYPFFFFFWFNLKGDDGRRALILESTIFHPQGGGQPSDTGLITAVDSDFKFIVQDVRSKDGIVSYYHP